MEVGIKVLAEEIHSGVVRHTNSCFFTMVAVDGEGRPVPVRPLQPQTADEHRRFLAATERKSLRAEMGRRLAGTHR
jgi:acyl-CoA hydrolase